MFIYPFTLIRLTGRVEDVSPFETAANFLRNIIADTRTKNSSGCAWFVKRSGDNAKIMQLVIYAGDLRAWSTDIEREWNNLRRGVGMLPDPGFALVGLLTSLPEDPELFAVGVSNDNAKWKVVNGKIELLEPAELVETVQNIAPKYSLEGKSVPGFDSKEKLHNLSKGEERPDSPSTWFQKDIDAKETPNRWPEDHRQPGEKE